MVRQVLVSIGVMAVLSSGGFAGQKLKLRSNRPGATPLKTGGKGFASTIPTPVRCPRISFTMVDPNGWRIMNGGYGSFSTGSMQAVGNTLRCEGHPHHVRDAWHKGAFSGCSYTHPGDHRFLMTCSKKKKKGKKLSCPRKLKFSKFEFTPDTNNKWKWVNADDKTLPLFESETQLYQGRNIAKCRYKRKVPTVFKFTCAPGQTAHVVNNYNGQCK